MGGENKTFRQRMNDLHSSDIYAKRRALWSFRNTRSEAAIQAIIDALDDPDVASTAAKALSGHKKSIRAVPKLILLLNAADSLTRSRAARALGVMRDHRALEPLAALLSDPDKGVKLEAAKALGHMGDRRAIQPMIDAIGECEPGSLDPELIWRELGSMGFADDVRHLSHLLHSKDWAVRPEDRLALLEPPARPMRRLPPEQIEKVRADIAELASPDEKAAYRAMSRLGRRRGLVVEFLAEATAGPNSMVRHLALHALELVGDPRAGPVVLAMADDPIRDTWWCAYEILGKLWKERAILILTDVLRDQDSESAKVDGAWRGLIEIGSPAVPAVVRVMETAWLGARQTAAFVLGRIGDEAAVGPLAQLLAAADPDLRESGIESLSQLGQDNPQSFGPRCLALIEPLVVDPDEDVRRIATSEVDELRKAIAALP